MDKQCLNKYTHATKYISLQINKECAIENLQGK